MATFSFLNVKAKARHLVSWDPGVEMSYARKLAALLLLYDFFGRWCHPRVKNGHIQTRILLLNR